MNCELLPIANKETSIKELILEMTRCQKGAVFICEDKKILWVFTDGDLRRCIESKFSLSTKVKDLTHKEPITIERYAKVSWALNLMKKNRISILPVVDDSKK